MLELRALHKKDFASRPRSGGSTATCAASCARPTAAARHGRVALRQRELLTGRGSKPPSARCPSTSGGGRIKLGLQRTRLFVTGTEVDGNTRHSFDDAGHPHRVKDHRSLFLLKHREGLKHPLRPGSSVDGPTTPETTSRRLAKLGAHHLLFPAAFTPVTSAARSRGQRDHGGKLNLWRELTRTRASSTAASSTTSRHLHIRRNLRRSADRLVERKLFYVEPDPRHFKRPDVASRPLRAGRHLVAHRHPGYESFADDLRTALQTQHKVQRTGACGATWRNARASRSRPRPGLPPRPRPRRRPSPSPSPSPSPCRGIASCTTAVAWSRSASASWRASSRPTGRASC